jgi:hypothetical protein
VRRSERHAWFERYDRLLLRPAARRELRQAASAAGQTVGGEASNRHASPGFEGSVSAEARSVAPWRSSSFAQRSGRFHSSDRSRSDPCSLHQHGRGGRFPCVFAVLPGFGASAMAAAWNWKMSVFSQTVSVQL